MSVVFTYRPPRINGAVKMHAAKLAAETAGAEVLLEAAVPLVPVDSEQLRDSGHIEHLPPGVAVVFQAVSEDGYEYGIRVHEDMDMNHPHGGQAHYLRQPMHTAGPAILAAMAAVARART